MGGRCGEGRPDEVKLPEGYRPRGDEAFMGPRQRAYFRRKLLRRRRDVLAGSHETTVHLRENSAPEPDIADRAPVESERPAELRTRDRARKLLAKIDAALRRLNDGTCGYCEETGEPIATLSIDAQERPERPEKTCRDD